MSGDEAESRTQAELAMTLGRRLDVRAAVVIGRTALGRLQVIGCEIDEGLRALDDVAAELMSGKVDPLTTGMMYCEIICAAQGLGRPDLKGFRYLDVLLRRAGAEVDVMDLIASGLETATARGRAEPGLSVGYGSGLPVLDEQVRDAYRRRLAEVDEDIENAEADHDLGRLSLAEHDREHLVAELARAFGIDGQSRTVGGDVERARGSITRSLRYSFKRLGALQPELAAHLDRSVSTGVYCCYRPDLLNPVTWALD